MQRAISATLVVFITAQKRKEACFSPVLPLIRVVSTRPAMVVVVHLIGMNTACHPGSSGRLIPCLVGEAPGTGEELFGLFGLGVGFPLLVPLIKDTVFDHPFAETSVGRTGTEESLLAPALAS